MLHNNISKSVLSYSLRPIKNKTSSSDLEADAISYFSVIIKPAMYRRALSSSNENAEGPDILRVPGGRESGGKGKLLSMSKLKFNVVSVRYW